MAIKNGTSGNDVLTGTQVADSIFGFAGNDSLLGLGGNDSLNGGAGKDTLDGGNGIDTLVGGANNDTYIITSTLDPITEAANSGIDSVQSSVTYTLGNNLENLTLTGTGAINGTGNDNDLNNRIIGNVADNSIDGAAGSDTLYGGDGNDNLYGGDDFFYDAGSDLLYGGSGNDVLRGGSYSMTGEARDTLYGGNGNDTLFGDDSRFGNANGDILDGGSGNDTYMISSTGDTLTEAANAGIDTVVSNVGFTLGSNIENLTLAEGVTGRISNNGTGNSLNNIIIGNFAHNILTGLGGNDNLNGEAGNDDLLGSSGGVGERDTLTGGTERDTFFLGNTTQVFYGDRNSATAGTGDYALITDFNKGEDIIKLNGGKSDYILKSSPSGLPKGTAIYLNKPSGEPDELIALVQGSSGLSLNGNYFRLTANEINLSTLNGSNGFKINGIDASDSSGTSVSDAGDINGDGFSDLIIGAPGADPNGQSRTGESYVVFGKAGGFSPSPNLSALNGSNGFRINGIDTGDGLGNSVSSAGDVNGDGFSDLIIGATGADPNGQSYAGESYVVFGKVGGFSPSLNLSVLNGSNGFKINGINKFDRSGSSVSTAGDINGDGFDDIIVGANGESYLMFGKPGSFGASLNLSTLDGSNGFKINGVGSSVSSAGDVNGDRFDDLIIGVPSGDDYTAESYVLFGKAEEFGASLNLSTLNGSNGFLINGINGDYLSTSVSSAGDINGDGFDDIIIGAAGQNEYRYYRRNDPGHSYVVFGKEGGFAPSLKVSTLNGSNGFVINGIDANKPVGSSYGGVDANDKAGTSVSSAGDVNGDGFDDLIIGAIDADPNGQDAAGESYVVFGKAGGFTPSLNLSDINGSNGFLINGIDADDRSGGSVSAAGDVNGDGFSDIMIGAAAWMCWIYQIQPISCLSTVTLVTQ